ncbi:MAG: hypothetical protein ACHQ1G_11155 [Planctomycetota bacterium]
MRTVRSTAMALVCLAAMAATSSAQSPEEKLAAELKQKLEAKLKEPFVANAPWVLDYADALKAAKEEKKFVFAYFTRSYSP